MGARGFKLVVFALATPTLALAACSGSSGTTAAGHPVQTLVPTVASTAKPSPRPVTTSAGPDIPANHRDIGYIVKVDHVSGTPYLEFDRILFLGGDEANKAAAAHGDETPVPNDYYIVNDNPLIRTFEVEPDVVVIKSITMGCSPNTCTKAESHTDLAELETYVDEHKDYRPPFHLHFDPDGKVDVIREQYLP